MIMSTLLSIIASAMLGLAGDASSPQEASFNLWDAEPRLPAVFLAEPAEPAPSFLPWQGEEKDTGVGFAIGPFGGFLEAKDADDGTWFAGLAARLYFLRFLAVEASVSFHESEFNNGNTDIWQIPVQLSALFIILPRSPIRPYIGGGVGWYYTKVEYEGALAFLDDETTNWFGGHVMGGAELRASSGLLLFADFRYIFIDPESDIEAQSGNPDYWQITFGLLFGY
jgi:hypothetical protein